MMNLWNFVQQWSHEQRFSTCNAILAYNSITLFRSGPFDFWGGVGNFEKEKNILQPYLPQNIHAQEHCQEDFASV